MWKERHPSTVETTHAPPLSPLLGSLIPHRMLLTPCLLVLHHSHT